MIIPDVLISVSPLGGADLVSCGGSGVVRFWNSLNSHLVGQFTSHNRDLGSIVMTVSPCGKHLVTADRVGILKTWDIEVNLLIYCTYIPAAEDHTNSQ